MQGPSLNPSKSSDVLFLVPIKGPFLLFENIFIFLKIPIYNV